MLLYSWNKVLKEARTLNDIIVILHSIHWNAPIAPKNTKFLGAMMHKDFSGYNFLLNPKPILTKLDISVKERTDYIALASQRNFAEFLLTGEKRLDLRLAPFIPEGNQLLTIDNNYISFAYEQQGQHDNII